MHINELDTPALLVDLNRLEANIMRVQQRCDELGLSLRAHVKTHKIPDIARMQFNMGAVGIACQKVSEAQVFADHGFNDIQIPYNIVGKGKTRRLLDLALFNRMTVTVDHLAVIEGLSETAKNEDINVRVLVELATDLERTGALTIELVDLVRRIESDSALHFAGIMAYPSTPANRPVIQEALQVLDRAGIGVDVISGGGTGILNVAHEIPELTEIRAGTYVFNDCEAVGRGWAAVEDCALTVAATVVSEAKGPRVILDCGSKSLSAVRFENAFGLICEYPQARIYKLDDEHAYVDVDESETRPQLGERVHVIPAHAATALNLHDQVYAMRDGEVETLWHVAARGRVW